MSYEVKMYVLDPYNHKEIPQTGQVMAMVELGAINFNGSLYKLIENSQNPQIPFAIRTEKPDGGAELMAWVQDQIDCGELPEDEKVRVSELNLEYENSFITTDKYNKLLGVTNLPEFLEALTAEQPTYQLKLAKVLLEEIKLISPYNGLFVKIITYGH